MNPEQPNSLEHASPIERLEHLGRKYNVKPVYDERRFESRTELPVVPVRPDSLTTPLARLGQNHYEQLAGAVAREEQPGNLPETVMYIGTRPTPSDIRSLSFRGEEMSSDEFDVRKVAHEMGHTAMFYELLPSIMERYPTLSMPQALMHLERQVGALRGSPTPLSQFEQISSGDGRPFYSEGELLYEDLAEAFATRTMGMDEWKMYTDLIINGTSGEKRQAAIEVLNLVNHTYQKALQ